MLKVEGLQVEIGARVLLREIHLKIEPGETVVLFGPNGSGKTSLLMAIMGYPQYRVTAGRIAFKGADITGMSIDQRARLGIGMAFQRPPAIQGLKMRRMVEVCAGPRGGAEELAARAGLSDLLERDLNVGFSGGEIKRSELLQLMAQSPDLLLIDEPESGVDLESIARVGKSISSMLSQDPQQAHRRGEKNNTMGLIISHTGFILDYVRADRALVLYDGTLACGGDPRKILSIISEAGYEECVRCMTN